MTRPKQVNIRFSEEEYAHLKRCAGSYSVNAWVRAAIYRAMNASDRFRNERKSKARVPSAAPAQRQPSDSNPNGFYSDDEMGDETYDFDSSQA